MPDDEDDAALLADGRALYAALRAGDRDALTRLLAVGFQGRLTPGLPHGLGRRYDGRDAMLAAFEAVGEWYDMAPHPDKLVPAAGVLVARGHYIGSAKATGKPMHAAFAHFWTREDGRFTAVRQVTDSGAWRDALEP